MIQYKISCPNPASQFLQIELYFPCQAQEKIQLQLPAWRAGRYQIANYSQNLRGFTASNPKGESLPFTKTSKDCWEITAPENTNVLITYSYWAGKMDAGSAWVDDQQVYVNLVNCCFELLGRTTEAITVQLNLDNYPQRVLTLKQQEPSTWIAENYQILADASLLAAKNLHRETYRVGSSQFHAWFHGEIHFDSTSFINQLQAFTTRMIADFGSFPEPEYQFIFQLLPYPHYHGVEHRRGTVITFGPASSLAEEEAQEELLGISCHELYHAWNVCRIRPKEFLPYDFSKETYSQAGLILEGVTTYFGDLYVLKSGLYNLPTYLRHLEKIFQREAAHHGWKNTSIEESSIDLWLDGYVAGIPDRKVNIYSRGALLCLCLDVLLLQEGSSLAQVMKDMWENFGLPFKGYELQDFEKRIADRFAQPEKIREFFDAFVRGRADLFPVLEDCLRELGILIGTNETENTVFNILGIQVNAQQVIQKIHPESIAYMYLMANDRLLRLDLKADSLHWEVEVARQGRKLNLSFAKEEGNFYPLLILKEGSITALRENWLH
ncbi:MAG: M61 family peptidase [Bacteroidetes bacterium]|nr:M61 family peptidase [Bacteroidota bacterium]